MKAEAGFLQADPSPRIGARLAELQVRVAGRLHLGLHSRSTRYGLRRDLTVHWERPTAKIPIEVRPMVEADLTALLSPAPGQDDPQERLEITWRRAFVEKCAHGCYVAIDLRDNSPCYMQWLMGADQNGLIRRLRTFPELQQGEALLENAYTPVSHRGLGIMSAAMAVIAEHAADMGVRYVLTFVDRGNVASLKSCQRAGFSPHLLHHKVQLGLGLSERNTFEILAPGDARRGLRF